MNENSNSITFLKTHGGTALLWQKYKFHKHKLYKNGSSLWRCSAFKKDKCRGTLTIMNETIIKAKEHTCDPDTFKNSRLKFADSLRNEVIDSDQPIPSLYTNKVITFKEKGLDLINAVPKFNSIRHLLYDTRNRALGVATTMFKTVEEVMVPIKFQDSVLADYCYDGTRIIVFCPLKSREIFPNVTEYFADGTFAVCPTPFCQIYNILGDYGSTFKVLPLLSAFMSNRKKSSYQILFQMIKSQLPSFKPLKIHCDFEYAAMSAIREEFSDTQLKGCYYHWSKNIWKKIKESKNNKTKPERRIIALSAVLPLLPPQYTSEGWKYIKSQIQRTNNINMGRFIQYMEKYWFKMYSSDVLSVFSERHRTDNVAEGLHSKLIKGINKTTVNLNRTLNVLNKYIGLESLSCSRKKNQIINDEFIMDIQMQLINGDISVYQALNDLR